MMYEEVVVFNSLRKRCGCMKALDRYPEGLQQYSLPGEDHRSIIHRQEHYRQWPRRKLQEQRQAPAACCKVPVDQIQSVRL
jgi:hypothetical protein